MTKSFRIKLPETEDAGLNIECFSMSPPPVNLIPDNEVGEVPHPPAHLTKSPVWYMLSCPVWALPRRRAEALWPHCWHQWGDLVCRGTQDHDHDHGGALYTHHYVSGGGRGLERDFDLLQDRMLDQLVEKEEGGRCSYQDGFKVEFVLGI